MTTKHSTPDDTPGDGPSDAVVFQHDWTEREELVGKIVSAVATVTDTDETEIERVYDRLDPESLNTLFSQARTDRHTTDARLVFSLETCTITVHGSGLVIVQQ
ncbi:HalOD1 output domain-containing protein [Halopiger goleimassiliensis]|uniref:HalOD1 output domain-containing protein n=1 Tax=Halopiger goleimassiliensis TaxID=1293048 RepID=UPI00067811B7|nr:HalOD1 output domain-containing protein [Halopiger goleimassiliensis]